MIGSLLCSALLCVGAHQDEPHVRALASLEAGALGDAWSALLDETHAFQRESTRVRICHTAGDLGGVLRHARLALRERPGDPEVLFFAAWAHVSLRDGAGAARVVGRLAAALGEAEFTAEERERWSEILARLEGEVEALRRLDQEHAGKLGRARVVSLTLLALVCSLLGWTSLKEV